MHAAQCTLNISLFLSLNSHVIFDGLCTLEMNQCIFRRPYAISSVFTMQHVMWQILYIIWRVCVCETKAESWEFNRNLVSCSDAIARWVSHFCGFTLHAYEHNSLECIILFDCILNVQLYNIQNLSSEVILYIFLLLFECLFLPPPSPHLQHHTSQNSCCCSSFYRSSQTHLKKKQAKLCSAFILDVKVLSLKCKTKYTKWDARSSISMDKSILYRYANIFEFSFYCSEANESVLLVNWHYIWNAIFFI